MTDKERIAIAISVLAIVISLGSLTVSLLAFLRDRTRVRVTSTFYPEPGHAQIRLSIVNVGRRPVVLTS